MHSKVTDTISAQSGVTQDYGDACLDPAFPEQKQVTGDNKKDDGYQITSIVLLKKCVVTIYELKQQLIIVERDKLHAKR